MNLIYSNHQANLFYQDIQFKLYIESLEFRFFVKVNEFEMWYCLPAKTWDLTINYFIEWKQKFKAKLNKKYPLLDLSFFEKFGIKIVEYNKIKIWSKE